MDKRNGMSFSELCESLSKTERQQLTRLVKFKTGKSTTTVWRWTVGLCEPDNFEDKETILQCVKRVLHINPELSTLFN